MDELIIAGQFNGPADSGNGGYTAGLVASRLAAAAGVATAQTAQVTLRVPPPLDTPLRVTAAGHGIEVYAGGQLVAEAAPVELPDDPPIPPISYPDAVAAATAYPGFVDHPFPTCYVCGPRRPAGDGLRIFPGPLPDGRTAAPWLVPDGCTEVTVWAALDCPGGWAILAPGRPYVLGRMAARVERVPPAGTACVVLGEVVATEGRKAQVRTALYGSDPAGRQRRRELHRLASARSTWIAV
ncbi:MAG: hypothetical protein GEV12_14900 [Micromonosporaceae bacterium]|nr:hypothetical protein [Micromonosporaceae bacterium]